MKYEDLITTVTTIVNDETISKRGLVLMYNLDETSHNKINEELFYKTNPVSMGFTPADEFEVVVGGILVKFVKQVAQ